MTATREQPGTAPRKAASAETTRDTDITPKSAAAYVIDGGEPGRERLRVVSRVLSSSTLSLLGQVGVPHDARILDLGCGGGDVTRLFARLAPHGEVIGVDIDPEVVAIANAETAEAGIDNIEMIVGDVSSDTHVTTTIDGLGPFDVVYARFLLSHLAEPDALVRRMRRWCIDGGVVVAEDVDVAGSICAPSNEAFRRFIEIYTETVRASGGDPQLGLRLPVMLRTAGLSDIETRVAQSGGLHGNGKQIQLITLPRIADAAIARGLTTHGEIERLSLALTQLIDRADTFVTTARVIQAWGRT